MAQLFIPLLLGSAREGRRSEHAARFVLAQAKALNQFETELVDVRAFVATGRTEAALSDERAATWSELMTRADGLMIVSPEYNHGYPGELKLMLDQLYEEYNRKPVGICGVSTGILGGGRMVEALRTSLIELQMAPIRNAVYFANAKDLFDEAGAIKDPAPYEKRLKPFFEELVWYAKALKTARETAPNGQ